MNTCLLCPAEAAPERKFCEPCLVKCRERNKKRRDALKAAGMCGKSCGRPAVPGRGGHCDECADKIRDFCRGLRAGLKQDGNCIRNCGKPSLPGHTYCDEHLKEQNKRSSDRSRQLVSEGFCREDCGRPLVEGRGGYCDDCARARDERRKVWLSKKPPEYRVWDGIIQRTTNPNSSGWQYYGARGITVCERWRVFEHFFADMGSRPSPEHSIDRINNDGNYEPGNCRWTTTDVQNANKRHRKSKKQAAGA